MSSNLEYRVDWRSYIQPSEFDATEGARDSLSIQIFEDLKKKPPKSTKPIFQVPENLRAVDRKADSYEPCMLAIGPYHRHKEEVKSMEEHKKRYLESILEGGGKANLERCVLAIRASEDKARSFYAEHDCILSRMSSDDFVKMMLLDGCFIVELLRRCIGINLSGSEDCIDSFNPSGWNNNKLARDLLLVENQIPFFVVEMLFNMTNMDKKDHIEHSRQGKLLVIMIIRFFASSLPHSQSLRTILRYPTQDIKHLLSFIQTCWFLSSKSAQLMKDGSVDLEKCENVENWRFINCATELREAGVEFMAVSKAERLSDIEFDLGRLKIPTITITDQSESVFKNLIVYEQSFSDDKNLTITNYMKFMDCLINSSMDVKLLCNRNVLQNRLGDHQDVADMFNRLGRIFTPSFPHSYYCEIFDRVNKHCQRRRNVWIALLKRRHFNSPWATISIGAAVVLLVLTLVQTVYSVLAYYFK